MGVSNGELPDPGQHEWAFAEFVRPEPPPRTPAIVMLGRAALQLRLYRGWSQRGLELASGVDQTTISRFERGTQVGLSVRRIARILDALLVGEVAFLPPKSRVPPTGVELMLSGDRWARAGDAAQRRLARPPRNRARRRAG
ncbi:MAG TPA: helix-turn-helix domain-containing protein [Gemmatimonadales bacterium]|nr:helix-turn-helix domain-containing protein [Gemmatimonadales bacterium]